jgi:5-methylcytosine-specific restriction endonuclease McrA
MVYARDRAIPGYVCPRCQHPIDWTLPYRDDLGQVLTASKSVDHLHESQDGGALTDLDNLASVHLSCNSSKGAERRHERAREARAVTSVIAIDPATL